MGKAGKQRKKLKSMHVSAPVQEDVENSWKTSDGTLITTQDLYSTIHVLNAFTRAHESLKDPHFRTLRSAIHCARGLVGTGVSVVGLVSDSISDQRWTDALVGLFEMQVRGIKPRLGSLQRWVRDCDAAAKLDTSISKGNSTSVIRDAQIMKVLDAILRTSDPAVIGSMGCDAVFTSANIATSVRNLGNWKFSEHTKALESDPEDPLISGKMITPRKEVAIALRPKFTLISHEEGADRKPPNKYSANIYTTDESIIEYSENVSTTISPIPYIPNASCIRNLLTRSECRQILEAAESIGFSPDQPVQDIEHAVQSSVLAHNVFWLTDPKMTSIIESRVLNLLPKVIQGEDASLKLSGINPRWRIYRYVPGAIYRPHIDGAWPPSSYNPTTKEYIYDASNGKTWSRFTLLIYLNEGFTGGETTYFVPSTMQGVLDSRGVVPSSGCAVVFPHGTIDGNMLHEGSGVVSGVKYIARTDVLYSKPHPNTI